MKRKVAFLIVFAIIVCFFAVNTRSVKVDVYANESDAYAEYVSLDCAPQIDGNIDDCWGWTSDFVAQNEDVSANVKILWNETGLYFLSIIVDLTINPSDRCNLWVSEKFISEKNSYLYPEVDGAYFLCLTPLGENKFYAPDSWTDRFDFDMSGKYEVGVVRYQDYYIVEVYVPTIGSSSLNLNDKIGFNVSIDDYLTEEAERNSYAYWANSGRYWEYPSHLAEVVLLDNYAQNGSLEGENEEESEYESSNEDSEKDSAESMQNSASDKESLSAGQSKNQSNNKKGCTSFFSLSGILGVLVLCSAIKFIEKSKK